MPKKLLDKARELVSYELVENKKWWINQLLERYNNLTLAFNEIEVELRTQKLIYDGMETSIYAINSAFKRIGASERIEAMSELGSVVANFLWKQQCLSSKHSVQNVENGEQIQEGTT